MPVTICPNCGSAMSEVSRRRVYIDVCSNCGGVWLDGGELEKMLATVDAGAEEAREERRYNSRKDYVDDHREDFDRRPQRKRRGGVFDMFEDLFD